MSPSIFFQNRDILNTHHNPAVRLNDSVIQSPLLWIIPDFKWLTVHFGVFGKLLTQVKYRLPPLTLSPVFLASAGPVF